MGFIRRHRHWALLITLAAIVLIVVGAISLRVVERISRGPAFQTAATFLRGNPTARQQLGVITGFGRAVAGDVTENGDSGIAHLHFDVHGSWRDGRAVVTAYRQDGVWTVQQVTLEVDGRQFPIAGPPAR
jgi:hypothetical protein